MVNAVDIAVTYVRRFITRNAFHEQRVDYSHVAPRGFGTCDIALEVYDKVGVDRRLNTLYIIDLKYGMGIKVAAFKNTQLLLYALGALRSLDMFFNRPIERIVVVIMQPRLDHIDEYELSVAELKAWGEEQKPKAELADRLYTTAREALELLPNNGPPDRIIPAEYFKPSQKACQWCQGRRASKCRAYALTGYSAAVEGFNDFTDSEKENVPVINACTLRDPAILDNVDLAAIYDKMDVFLDFAKNLGKEIARRIKAGQTVPGLKLVDTQKSRAWKGDEEDVIKALRTAGLQKTEYLKQVIISPAEAEKALKIVKPKDYKRRYRRLEAAAIHRPPGEPKIVSTGQVEDVENLLD
jgi:hypothetical protein